MNEKQNQPLSVLPLVKSDRYLFPLHPTKAQARWLQTQCPTDSLPRYFPFLLIKTSIRQVIWRESQLFSPLFPSGLAVELFGLPQLAMEALARYTPDELLPTGWPQGDPRAWLCPDSPHIVAQPNGEYSVELAFWSTQPLFHYRRRFQQAVIRQMNAELRADDLAAELQQVRNELDQVMRNLMSHATPTELARTPVVPFSSTLALTRPDRASSRRKVR